MNKWFIVMLSLLLSLGVLAPAAMASSSTTVNATFQESGRTVTVTGTMGAEQGKVVTVKIVNPSNQLEHLDQTLSGNGGGYSFAYQVIEAEQGTYKVFVSGEGAADIASTTFEMNEIAPGKTISVTGKNGVTTIDSLNGTLEMIAILQPDNAVTTNVAWSVYESDGTTATDKAEISAEGLLKAKKDGVVKVKAVSKDNADTQGSTLITLSNQAAGADPVVMIQGTASVASGQSFTLDYGLTNVTTSVYQGNSSVANTVYGAVYAFDAVLTYNPDVLTFVNADPIRSSLILQKVLMIEPNKVQIAGYLSDANQDLTDSGYLFRTNWKAKATTVNVDTVITTSSMQASDRYGTILEPVLKNHSLVVEALNQSSLLQLISSAQTLFEQATEGVWRGDYPSGSKNMLLTALNTARTVAQNANATQQQLDDVAGVLSQAIQTFTNSRITEFNGDMNNDGQINKVDLEFVVEHYNKTTQSLDWSSVQKADYNQNGRIDIVDLVAIAMLIK
ncbi:dockerin type I domain-containing protein [Paenibacillus sp. y28]|uniref:dockerin type I domain-containing protein n=1 Tax=Paenibacillus sp. y28 TaxID=3129110 RepID=UPI00301688B0